MNTLQIQDVQPCVTVTIDQLLVIRNISCTNNRQVSWLTDPHRYIRLPGLPVTSATYADKYIHSLLTVTSSHRFLTCFPFNYNTIKAVAPNIFLLNLHDCITEKNYVQPF